MIDIKVPSIDISFWNSRKRKRKKEKISYSHRAKKHPSASKGYYKNKKYLGKRVKDIGGVGLDTYKEFIDILREIKSDVKNRRISKKTARGRLLLLYRLTFPSKNRKARKIPLRLRKVIRKKIKEVWHSL